jgi:hypothetical protein
VNLSKNQFAESPDGRRRARAIVDDLSWQALMQFAGGMHARAAPRSLGLDGSGGPFHNSR